MGKSRDFCNFIFATQLLISFCRDSLLSCCYIFPTADMYDEEVLSMSNVEKKLEGFLKLSDISISNQILFCNQEFQRFHASYSSLYSNFLKSQG